MTATNKRCGGCGGRLHGIRAGCVFLAVLSTHRCPAPRVSVTILYARHTSKSSVVTTIETETLASNPIRTVRTWTVQCHANVLDTKKLAQHTQASKPVTLQERKKERTKLPVKNRKKRNKAKKRPGKKNSQQDYLDRPDNLTWDLSASKCLDHGMGMNLIVIGCVSFCFPRGVDPASLSLQQNFNSNE